MNDELKFWKGSSGYSAPGRDGIRGEDGNNIHFSSIDISTYDSSTAERINAKKCLSDNPNVTYPEQYKDQDYILDIYGDLYVLSGIDENNPEFNYVGNIFFHPDADEYRSPIESVSGECILNFEIDSTTKYLNNDNYTKHTESDSAYQSTLWHHRLNDYRYAQNMPCFEISPSSTDTLTFDGSTYTSEEFVSYISETENYHKICAVMNNGLVIEKITSPEDTGILIELGYINMIDINLTNAVQYDSFYDEIKRDGKMNSYRKFFQTGHEKRMCNMYFEYSHGNEIYRMKINTQ